jgi:hypothetical protein
LSRCVPQIIEKDVLRVPIDPSSHDAEPIESGGRVVMSLGKFERGFMAVICEEVRVG